MYANPAFQFGQATWVTEKQRWTNSIVAYSGKQNLSNIQQKKSFKPTTPELLGTPQQNVSIMCSYCIYIYITYYPCYIMLPLWYPLVSTEDAPLRSAAKWRPPLLGWRPLLLGARTLSRATVARIRRLEPVRRSTARSRHTSSAPGKRRKRVAVEGKRRFLGFGAHGLR